MRGGTGLVTALTESTTLTDCTGNATGFGYDSYGNKTSITNARFYGGGSPPQTTMTYDLGGRNLTVTNELSHTTTNTYNNRNQVLTTTDNLGNVSKNTYDALGKIKTVTDAVHAAVSTPESRRKSRDPLLNTSRDP